MEEGSNTGGISLERCNLTTSKGLDREKASATTVGGGRGQKREKEGPPIEEGSKKIIRVIRVIRVISFNWLY
jgi:hypothetical protein